MAWSEPITRTTGTQITAAIWNEIVGDIVYLGNTHDHYNAAGAGGGAALLAASVPAGQSTGTGNIVKATSPTIVTPTIASLVNMTHNHQSAAAGGDLRAPICTVYKSAQQSIPNGVGTVLNFDAEFEDANSLHDLVTNNSRITIATTGVYLVFCQNIPMELSATGYRYAMLSLDGAVLAKSGTVPGSASEAVVIPPAIMVERITAESYVQALVYQNSGGALLTVTAGYAPQFGVVWLGP